MFDGLPLFVSLILIHSARAFETEHVENVTLELRLAQDEQPGSESNDFCNSEISIGDTIALLQKDLQTKAMLNFHYVVQDELEKTRKDGTLRVEQLEVLVHREEASEMTTKAVKLSSCDTHQEFLRILSMVFKEDFTYFSPFPATGSCSLETILSEPQSSARDSEAPSLEEVARRLLPLSEHVFREFVNGGPHGELAFVAFWNREVAESVQLVRQLGMIEKGETERHSIGMLHCPSVKRVCVEAAIDDVPQLLAYRNDVEYRRYEGTPEASLIADWMKMLNEPVLYELSEAQMPNFRSGILPNSSFGDEKRPSVTLGCFASDKLAEYEAYVKLAHELHGEYHFGILVHPDISKWAHNPALITFKDGEMVEKVETLYDRMDVDSMRNFVIESSRPSVYEINARTVAAIDGRGKCAVVMVEGSESNEKLRLTFHSLASIKPNREQITYAYVQATPQHELAKKLIQTWQLRIKILPAIVVLKPPKCLPVVKYPDEAITVEELLNWIRSAAANGTEEHEGEKEERTKAKDTARPSEDQKKEKTEL